MYDAVNWNHINKKFTKDFWDQNIRQFWIDEEISLSDDKLMWSSLSLDERDLYKKVTAGLTLLDTQQACLGIPSISREIKDYQTHAVLSFIGFMEHMHAKSYSSIFSSLCSTEEIDDLFTWVSGNKLLQDKVGLITDVYKNIHSEESLFMGIAASVLLESFLFYSGFFFPLYMSGQGKLVASGEIINLIIRDESIHGLYLGLLGQDLLEKFSPSVVSYLRDNVYKVLEKLFVIEKAYIEYLYSSLGLVNDVVVFTQYNADKALMNLGLEPFFNIPESNINAVVLRGLDTKTKNHDFFSTKGNGYIKTTHVENLTDEDFNDV